MYIADYLNVKEYFIYAESNINKFIEQLNASKINLGNTYVFKYDINQYEKILKNTLLNNKDFTFIYVNPGINYNTTYTINSNEAAIELLKSRLIIINNKNHDVYVIKYSELEQERKLPNCYKRSKVKADGFGYNFVGDEEELLRDDFGRTPICFHIANNLISECTYSDMKLCEYNEDRPREIQYFGLGMKLFGKHHIENNQIYNFDYHRMNIQKMFNLVNLNDDENTKKNLTELNNIVERSVLEDTLEKIENKTSTPSYQKSNSNHIKI